MTKKQHFIPHNRRLVATAAKHSGKRMINGCAAITMRQSDYHIDSLPDGLSSLISSWAIEKYLFETRMWGWEKRGSAACVAIRIELACFQPEVQDSRVFIFFSA